MGSQTGAGEFKAPQRGVVNAWEKRGFSFSQKNHGGGLCYNISFRGGLPVFWNENTALVWNALTWEQSFAEGAFIIRPFGQGSRNDFLPRGVCALGLQTHMRGRRGRFPRGVPCERRPTYGELSLSLLANSDERAQKIHGTDCDRRETSERSQTSRMLQYSMHRQQWPVAKRN